MKAPLLLGFLAFLFFSQVSGNYWPENNWPNPWPNPWPFPWPWENNWSHSFWGWGHHWRNFTWIPPNVTNASCVPTYGGRVILTGTGLNYTSLIVMIGSNLCTNPLVLEYNQLSCVVPPGTGGFYNISVGFNASHLVTQRPFFSYCAPYVSSATSVFYSNTSGLVTVSGMNFGTNPGQIQIQLTRVNSNPAITVPCLGVSIVSNHVEFTCLTNISLWGQFFIQLAVGGIPSPSGLQVTLTNGTCYRRYGFAQSTIDSSLLLISLQKNSATLKDLMNKLSQIQSNLPVFNGENCCGSDAYPVGSVMLSEAASQSYIFKECMDSFADNANAYLNSL